MLKTVASPATRNKKIRIEKPVSFAGLQPLRALADFVSGIGMWRIWLALSWQEFRSTYRRSLLGVAWVIISFALFLLVKLTIFTNLLHTPDAQYYNAYLVLGLFVWMYLSQSVNGAPDTFIAAQGWIKSEPLPYTLYAVKAVMREFYNFALTAIPVGIALYFIGFPFTKTAFYCLPAIAFYFINSLSLKLLLGIIGARFRDVSHLVKAVMWPMMFLSPIFWMPSQMEALIKYLWWNPFYHYINIFRAPIIDHQVPWDSWIFVAATYSMITFVGFLFLARFRQRLVFWF